MRITLKILVVTVFLAALPLFVKASELDISVTPSLIDAQCKKRDMLEYTIKIKNNSNARANIYAQVNDLTPETGLINYSDPSELNQDTSLTRWINFRRAVIEIQPGTEVEESLKISVSPNAVPGKYHAIIFFPTGSTMTQAQQAASEFNEAKLLINLEVVENKVEQLEISQFKSAKNVFINNPIKFVLKLRNIGTEVVSPSGEIVVYSKRGKEVGAIKIAGNTISPGETKDFSVSDKLNLGPGKYKARLSINYGQNNKDLMDITYFSYLPLVVLIIFIIVLLTLVFLTISVLNKKRRQKMGIGGQETERVEDFYSKPKKILNLEKPRDKRYVINLKKD
jgi:uncharacterized repeat protein (TIGR01451 family)